MVHSASWPSKLSKMILYCTGTSANVQQKKRGLKKQQNLLNCIVSKTFQFWNIFSALCRAHQFAPIVLAPAFASLYARYVCGDACISVCLWSASGMLKTRHRNHPAHLLPLMYCSAMFSPCAPQFQASQVCVWSKHFWWNSWPNDANINWSWIIQNSRAWIARLSLFPGLDRFTHLLNTWVFLVCCPRLWT